MERYRIVNMDSPNNDLSDYDSLNDAISAAKSLRNHMRIIVYPRRPHYTVYDSATDLFIELED